MLSCYVVPIIVYWLIMHWYMCTDTRKVIGLFVCYKLLFLDLNFLLRTCFFFIVHVTLLVAAADLHRSSIDKRYRLPYNYNDDPVI